MAHNYIDRSNYVKGLLLLIGKDEKITDRERFFLHTVGKTLSFNKRFIENAINELFDNKYLEKEPPVFSRKQYAEAFLRDAIQLALVDDDLSDEEIDWLHATAAANDISKEWLEKEIEDYQCGTCLHKVPVLQIDKIIDTV
jgi:hypothetical protein